ncbi:hypothetical protein C0J52_22738 [Blattella germanica]|nr:hypothetical protein C0J52_22738 [Blattella germanica]
MGETNIGTARERKPPDILQQGIESGNFVDDFQCGRLFSVESYNYEPVSKCRFEDISIEQTLFTDDFNICKIKLQQEISKRENCEKQISELKRKLEETRQALIQSLSLQDDMCQTVGQLQENWKYFDYQWAACEGLEINLNTRRMDGKGMCQGRENVRHPDNMSLFTESCPKENDFFEEGTFEQHTLPKLITNDIVREKNEDIVIETKHLFEARKELMVKGRQLENFKQELVKLKKERKKNEFELKEIDKKIHLLTDQRLSLFNIRSKIQRRECYIENEIQLLYNSMDQINSNIREYLIKELQEVNDYFQDHEFNFVVPKKELDCKSVTDRYTTNRYSPNCPSEEMLMGRKNEERFKYVLQLDHTMKKINEIEGQLLNYNYKNGVKDKMHHGKEIKHDWPKYKPINVDDSLVFDGTEPSLHQSTEIKSKEKRRKRSFYFEKCISYESVADVKKIMNDNNFQFEKSISELFKEQSVHLKEEMQIMIKEEMKHIIPTPISVGNNKQQFTLGNNIQNKLSLSQQQCKTDEPADIECSIENEEISGLGLEDAYYLHYGSFTAYSYFLGYLELILKAHPFGLEHSKGFTERINTYINHHHLREDSFPVTKLFIVVPLSLDVPINVVKDSVDDNSINAPHWLEDASPLEPLEFHVVGVRNRTYDVPVYKLKDPSSRKRPKYVAIAVALKSLFDVFCFNVEDFEFFKTNKDEIISVYCKALEEIILENHHCKDLCEIILFRRTDSNGKRVNLAKVILRRIKQLHKEKNKMSGTLHYHDARRKSN